MGHGDIKRPWYQAGDGASLIADVLCLSRPIAEHKHRHDLQDSHEGWNKDKAPERGTTGTNPR